jgi:trehalose synthase
VLLPATSARELLGLVGQSRAKRFAAAGARAREALSRRTVWHVNSTATGGGVAEMLRSLLPLARGVGVDTRWLVVSGPPEFFRVTKRLHNRIYDLAGDRGDLGAAERAIYDGILGTAARDLVALISPGDVVVLHDPQTAGLVHAAKAAGALVIWRCHIGSDLDTDRTRSAWSFLAPDISAADRVVFSRASFAPAALPPSQVRVVPPSLDPFSVKNLPLSDATVRDILVHAGLAEAVDGNRGHRPHFRHTDGSPGRVNRRADVLQAGPSAPLDRPLVVQVSRWDRAKDMLGVLEAFGDVALATSADLVLAGPVVSGVADDPEGGDVLQECMTAWQGLLHAVRTRIHLACLPMRDTQENAVIVNALQRHAAVVTQKSLAEGFGLTVTEAMWKARPVVASAVGGIQDQIVDGVSGLLVPDPRDYSRFARLLVELLRDPVRAARLGAAAEERVRQEFLGDVHLERWAAVLLELVDPDTDLAEPPVLTAAVPEPRPA